MRALVTGSAGFIGFHLCRRLLDDGHLVFGFDAMTPYYDRRLKERRNALLVGSNRFAMQVAPLEDMAALSAFAREARPDVIVHLAAQAGVRYSIENPRAYIDSNVVGTFNLLEIARELAVAHLLVASTSSVYGANTQVPFAEDARADHQMSLYAATKKAGESMAHVYAHLWGLPTTLFRFFTVYGPWGRPDMAPLKFVDAIANGRPIEIYNHGDMQRDFTYVDDLVEAVVRLIDLPPSPAGERGGDDDPSLSPVAPYRIVNIGRSQPINLLDFIEAIERALGKPAVRRYVGMQAGDMTRTFASTQVLERLTGFRPCVSLEEGIAALVAWYGDVYAPLVAASAP